jgi:hypothetical protein
VINYLIFIVLLFRDEMFIGNFVIDSVLPAQLIILQMHSILRHGPEPEDYSRSTPWGTREMVYFRIKVDGLEYKSDERAHRLLNDPWCEFNPSFLSVCREHISEVEKEDGE